MSIVHVSLHKTTMEDNLLWYLIKDIITISHKKLDNWWQDDCRECLDMSHGLFSRVQKFNRALLHYKCPALVCIKNIIG